ncbi:AN1-type zinc finger protein 2A-like [Cimex lectularius]|uniref:AN1-type domain-containing protein n=1 Tax=Cimex lectularius TaxID=79782 RepID=A0A8I6RZ60_CIMLE|nr:AN1-type zinc finger protein 2A-like [Cimex lectularius]XP_014252893.1 AN1-type zinc finger protein 2A-like [Cimex lectularius]XP_014252894.1 AN1-type zinc finger protein 2A-like [Cimex lectularius]
MEFPELGQHCSAAYCRKLDFLPVKCDACTELFCHEHMSYLKHNCPKSDARNVQVPVCPLCNAPVPSKRGEMPDIAVGAHIDRDCQSDPAKNRRKVFSNKCNLKGCKKKELFPVICKDCHLNFCISHRHPTDHNCNMIKKVIRTNGPKQKHSSNVTNYVDVVQGQMSEDEALAHALALSLEENNHQSSSNNSEQSTLRNGGNSLTEWKKKQITKPSTSTHSESCSIS